MTGVWMTSGVSLMLGLMAGYFMHRSDFCLAAAFRDLFLFRSLRLLRPLVLLVAVSALLFELARQAALLPAYPFPFMGGTAWTTLAGGFLFGIGMVLAGGCVVGLLYKLGAGSLLAAIGVFGLVAGSALYAEIHPYWAELVSRSRWSTSAITLPQLLGLAPVATLALAAVGLFLTLRWQRRRLLQIENAAEGFIQPWFTALILALAGLASAILIGMPLSVTTSYVKLAALAESMVIPQHVAATVYFASRPVHYALPLGGPALAGGAGPQWDVIAVIQYPLILGIVLGAALSARRLGEFRPHWRLPATQCASVLAGGMVMALGARMAQGCNVWHLLGGLPILALQSLLFLAGLLPGAWLGSRLLLKLLTSTGGTTHD